MSFMSHLFLWPRDNLGRPPSLLLEPIQHLFGSHPSCTQGNNPEKWFVDWQLLSMKNLPTWSISPARTMTDVYPTSCILLPVSRFREFLRTSTGAWIFSKHPTQIASPNAISNISKKIRKQERWGENRTCMQTLKSIPSRKISRGKSLGGIRKKKKTRV